MKPGFPTEILKQILTLHPGKMSEMRVAPPPTLNFSGAFSPFGLTWLEMHGGDLENDIDEETQRC